MKMFLKRLPTGMFGSNCYILADNGEGVVIDPGNDSKDILAVIEKNGLKIKYIIITHAHIDHIVSMEEVRKMTGAKVLLHQNEASSLTDSRYNGSAMFWQATTFESADGFVKDGDILEMGEEKLEIIHTPGHSAGGICIKAGKNLFTGDTLFKMSIGRTDLGNGSQDTLITSIKEKLLGLDNDTVIYPGHGTSSTIGFERDNNPFLRD